MVDEFLIKIYDNYIGLLQTLPIEIWLLLIFLFIVSIIVDVCKLIIQLMLFFFTEIKELIK